MAFATSTLATIAAISSIAGLGMSVMGNMQAAQAAKAQGEAQAQSLEYQAAQARVNAGQARAASQRQAIAVQRKQRIAQSNLQASAAASGGGATDTSVIDISGDIAQEGQYRALSALYEGEDKAQGLENQATLWGYEANNARRAGATRGGLYQMAAIGTALSGGGTLLDKYGGSGPPASSGGSKGYSNYGLTKTGDFYG